MTPCADLNSVLHSVSLSTKFIVECSSGGRLGRRDNNNIGRWGMTASPISMRFGNKCQMLAYNIENPAKVTTNSITTASILPHYQMSHHAHHLADQKGSNSSFFVIVLNVDIDDVYGGIVRGIQGLVLIEKILVDLLIGDAKLVAVGSVWSSPWKFHLVSCPKRLHVEPFLAEINSNTPLIAAVQHVKNTPPAPTISKVRCMTYTIQTDDVPVQLTTTNRVTTTKWSTRFELWHESGNSLTADLYSLILNVCRNLRIISWHPNTSRPNRICSGGPIHPWLWSCGSQTQTGPPEYVPVAQSTPGYGLVASKHKLAHQDMFRWPNPPLAMVSWHPNTNWPNRICSGGPIHPWLWSRGIQTQTGPPEYVPVAQATPGYGLVESKHKLDHQDMFRWPNLSLAMVMVLKQKEDSLVARVLGRLFFLPPLLPRCFTLRQFDHVISQPLTLVRRCLVLGISVKEASKKITRQAFECPLFGYPRDLVLNKLPTHEDVLKCCFQKRYNLALETNNKCICDTCRKAVLKLPKIDEEEVTSQSSENEDDNNDTEIIELSTPQKEEALGANASLKLQLWEVQKHIISLGESQGLGGAFLPVVVAFGKASQPEMKCLVQQLRKELEANSTNCTLTSQEHLPYPNKSRPPSILRKHNDK
uniref:Uncharacterized protein n=1 Tax=Timema tahoe TaxID=61484 RepID=A0A7R9NV94_9NEOP|nr:unnamed protein product [Timema tahoe]